MASLLISSSEEYSGKSSICMGLGKIFQNKGYKIGYMKPVGNLLIDVYGSLVDEDSENIRQLLGLEDSSEFITPIYLTDSLINETLAGVKKDHDGKIRTAYNKLSKGKDIMIIEGTGGIGGGAMYGLSDPEVAVKLNTRILLVTRFESIFAIDRILCDLLLINDPKMLVGVILNEVPTCLIDRVHEHVVPFLKSKGIVVFGVIPSDETLRSIPIADIVEGLHAEVLVGSNRLNDLVDNYLVGAMEAVSAIKYFRRSPDNAVITGGDRADIQMAAIEARVKCLILTGNMHPSNTVLSSADTAGIPVILVRGDTMGTIERMEHLIGHAHVKQEVKLNRILTLLEKHVDVKSIADSVGLKV